MPTSHRTQIVTEAVVSAYIHEIAQPQRLRHRADVRTDRVAAPHALASSPSRVRPHGRARGRALERRRGHALELAA
jgi:hypothetical protein